MSALAHLRSGWLRSFALLLVLLTGCGYHTTGSTAASLPSEIHTIAIPAFTNKTPTYKIEQTLTAAVVREFASRSNYKIIYGENKEADAVLQGTVTSTNINPVTYDSSTG